ncbi:MAG: AMP-binding protein, partial [Bryobacteraceae bacterium]
MFIELSPGPLSEPLSGRHWSPADVRAHVHERVSRYRRLGLKPGDRVLVLFGNCLEFFADLLAVWRLGCCAVPLDSRLTDFEIGVLAQAAGARVALING